MSRGAATAPATRETRARGALVGLLALAAATVLGRTAIAEDPRELWIPVVALVLAAVAAQVPRLGPQLLTRAAFWSNLVLGALICVLGSRRERSILGAPLVLACGLALMVADRRALAAASATAGYRPARFAGTLQLLMVLALADAQTLGLFAALSLHNEREHPQAFAFAVVALAFAAGFVGLYRLALWGVFATMGAAAALLVAALAGVFQGFDKLVVPLTVLAIVQLVVPVPMLVAMATRRPLPAPAPRAQSVLSTVAVALLVAAAWITAFLRDP